LTEQLREAGIPARDLPLPGETFPGWELLRPLVAPLLLRCSICSKTRS